MCECVNGLRMVSECGFVPRPCAGCLWVMHRAATSPLQHNNRWRHAMHHAVHVTHAPSQQYACRCAGRTQRTIQPMRKRAAFTPSSGKPPPRWRRGRQGIAKVGGCIGSSESPSIHPSATSGAALHSQGREAPGSSTVQWLPALPVCQTLLATPPPFTVGKWCTPMPELCQCKPGAPHVRRASTNALRCGHTRPQAPPRPPRNGMQGTERRHEAGGQPEDCFLGLRVQPYVQQLLMCRRVVGLHQISITANQVHNASPTTTARTHVPAQTTQQPPGGQRAGEAALRAHLLQNSLLASLKKSVCMLASSRLAAPIPVLRFKMGWKLAYAYLECTGGEAGFKPVHVRTSLRHGPPSSVAESTQT